MDGFFSFLLRHDSLLSSSFLLSFSSSSFLFFPPFFQLSSFISRSFLPSPPPHPPSLLLGKLARTSLNMISPTEKKSSSLVIPPSTQLPFKTSTGRRRKLSFFSLFLTFFAGLPVEEFLFIRSSFILFLIFFSSLYPSSQSRQRL